MSRPTPSPEQLFAEAVELAEQAGALTLPHFKSRGQAATRKPDGTPVTEADREAERYLRQEVGDRYPDDAILGEEGGATGGSSGRRWYFDPIDGTIPFIQGVPTFSTVIAVEDHDGVIAGAIHLPALGETIAAGRGLGCFFNGTRARVSSIDTLGDAILSATEYVDMPWEMLSRLRDSPVLLRGWGDAYGYGLVATGRQEAMLDPIANPWDLAPMPLLLAEAGGRFTELDGNATHTGGSGLATNGLLHDELLAILHVADRTPMSGRRPEPNQSS